MATANQPPGHRDTPITANPRPAEITVAPVSAGHRHAEVIRLPAREISDRAQTWLRNAMIALAVLATAAAVVSWDAQYVLVRAVKHSTPVTALEAGIPDVGALNAEREAGVR